mmetsp:Transcript_80167/g.141448  ORF Transcript_80167/g.141448 Transcript_80167/m.141448 type:complete len:266 (+) Transcript_80167:758-1555(+)
MGTGTPTLFGRGGGGHCGPTYPGPLGVALPWPTGPSLSTMPGGPQTSPRPPPNTLSPPGCRWRRGQGRMPAGLWPVGSVACPAEGLPTGLVSQPPDRAPRGPVWIAARSPDCSSEALQAGPLPPLPLPCLARRALPAPSSCRCTCTGADLTALCRPPTFLRSSESVSRSPGLPLSGPDSPLSVHQAEPQACVDGHTPEGYLGPHLHRLDASLNPCGPRRSHHRCSCPFLWPRHRPHPTFGPPPWCLSWVLLKLWPTSHGLHQWCC